MASDHTPVSALVTSSMSCWAAPVFLIFGRSDTAALVHLLDEDAEAFGGSGVAGAQAAGLPGRRRSLQQQGACGVDLGDAGNVHLAGELGRRRDRHAQALERCVELGGLGHGPGAACDQAERRAAELDAEARRARLGGEAERMVAFQHEA